MYELGLDEKELLIPVHEFVTLKEQLIEAQKRIAELEDFKNKVAPFLAIHNAFGYSMGELVLNDEKPKEGYDWCLRCGEDTWPLDLQQCEKCGFTD